MLAVTKPPPPPAMRPGELERTCVEGVNRLSGRKNRSRRAIALAFSATLHVLFISLVINESATPYQLPEPTPPPMELQIYPPQEVPPPPPPPVEIPPKIKEALKEASQTPPVVPPIPQPPKPEATPPTPVAPPKVTQPKPSPPTPAPTAPPTPTPARPTPPKPSPLAAAPVPAKTPAPPAPAPSPSPAPKPSLAPTPSVTAPNPVTARVVAPVIVAHPSLLNLHKPLKQAPASVPTLPMAPSGQAGGGGGGTPGGAAGGPLNGSRLNGLSPYPSGAMPSGGPGLRGTLVGCANAEAVSLTSVERAKCNERFGVEAAKAPVLSGMDPGRRAEFDKTAERQENERKHGGGMPVGTDPGALGLGGLGSPK